MRLILPLLVLITCSPTGPDDVEVDWAMVTHYWDMAEAELGITRFSPDKVSWTARDGNVLCNGELSYGCFNTNGRITYNVYTPGVIKQEACHAIKYYNGSKDWRENCHSAPDN